MPPASAPHLTLVHDARASHSRSDMARDEEGKLSLDSLYNRFAPYVAAIATRILGREGEVQDVVQDVFAAAVKGLRVRDDPQAVRGWLAKVAVRTSMRKLRMRRLWRIFDLDETPEYDRLADPSAGPYEQQLVSEVYRTLDRLNNQDRVAWVLRHVEGESLDSAAHLCGCSLATVKRRIARAHIAINKSLAGHRLPSSVLEERYVD